MEETRSAVLIYRFFFSFFVHLFLSVCFIVHNSLFYLDCNPQPVRRKLGAVLVLVFVVYNRRRESHIKYPGPDDDVRENIINYDDEGGGEDDMTAYDITPLQIPIGPMPELTQCKMPPLMYPVMTMGPGHEPNVGMFIEEHKKRADSDPNAPPFDDLRNYAYEGGGSTAGSLSSLQSGTDDEVQEFDYLDAWGPRFDKLANMYGDHHPTELDELH